MRLNFSVLWFEDDEEWLKELNIESLDQEISSRGFILNIEFVNTPDKFYTHAPFTDFDLIVIDRTLEGYPEGEKFIEELRTNGVFTEVIFYSAGSIDELWQAIHEMRLEGVFVSDRGNVTTRIERVGLQAIRKVLDLENMRGIVMAEVGELDHLLDEIIRRGMGKLKPEEQQEIFNSFHEKANKQTQGRQESLEEFNGAPDIEKMLSLCDSDKRWQNFNRLRKVQEELNNFDEIGNYVEEVLSPRNFLAHGKPEKQEDGSSIFYFNGKEFHFTEEISLTLRKTFHRYKRGFSSISATLK